MNDMVVGDSLLVQFEDSLDVYQIPLQPVLLDPVLIASANPNAGAPILLAPHSVLGQRLPAFNHATYGHLYSFKDVARSWPALLLQDLDRDGVIDGSLQPLSAEWHLWNLGDSSNYLPW